MEIKDIKRIFFLGIGGIGMSALARYFIAGDYKVAGYDRTATPLTSLLEEEGCRIHFDSSVENIPEEYRDEQEKASTLVIYTPAVKSDNKEFEFFASGGYEIKKRAEVLGMISRELVTTGVAGTHGKTTVSTMLAHLLKQSLHDCTAFLGGISKNYESNLLLGKGDMAVVEADEFDRSFLQLSPAAAIITSMDPDHLDIYGDREQLVKSFRLFVDKISEGGKLLIKEELLEQMEEASLARLDVYTYSLGAGADFYAVNTELKEGQYRFDMVTPGGKIERLRLGMAGLVNVENAIAAASMSWLHGVDEDEIRNALMSFSGVTRRFDYRFREEGLVYIDDYAHHPEELSRFIASVKQLYPSHRICGIFQPHLYSRTKDHYKGFASSLEMLDELILLDIYPAREKPIKGVNSALILDNANMKNKSIMGREEVLEYIKTAEIDVLLTIGAGDIDKLVKPIVDILEKRD